MRKLCVALLACVGLAGSAEAVVTATASENFEATTRYVGSFDQFDAGLGALLSTTISYTGTANTSYTNSGYPQPVSGAYYGSADYMLYSSSNQYLTGGAGTSFSGRLPDCSDPVCFVSGSGSGTDTYTLNDIFTGTGKLNVVAQGGIVPSAGPTIPNNFQNYTVSGTVTYNYIPAAQLAAPEPASWAMMLAGFGAIGGALRARRRSKSLSTC